MTSACPGCQDGKAFKTDFTMAFQPIVDVVAGEVWAYEALVRGPDGDPAGSVLQSVTPETLYAFDQACRVKAIKLAGARMPEGSRARLSINFLPKAVYEPRACIRASLAAAAKANFDPSRLMFEFTENERIDDVDHVENIIREYHKMGFTVAIDDFGAGHSGLVLLARFRPDVLKLDMDLIRNIDSSHSKQAIVAGVAAIARSLDIDLLAEGVETKAELGCLRAAGIRLFQGWLFGEAAVERFEEVDFAALGLSQHPEDEQAEVTSRIRA